MRLLGGKRCSLRCRCASGDDSKRALEVWLSSSRQSPYAIASFLHRKGAECLDLQAAERALARRSVETSPSFMTPPSWCNALHMIDKLSHRSRIAAAAVGGCKCANQALFQRLSALLFFTASSSPCSFDGAERRRVIVSGSGKRQRDVKDAQQQGSNVLAEVHSSVLRHDDAVSHRRALGALLNGGGIDRSKVGDMIVSSDGLRIACAITPNLVGAACSALPGLAEPHPGALKQLYAETNAELLADSNAHITRTVPSMRADALAAAALDLSRSQARDLAERGCILANWQEMKAHSHLEGSETVTVRGHGRFYVHSWQVSLTSCLQCAH